MVDEKILDDAEEVPHEAILAGETEGEPMAMFEQKYKSLMRQIVTQRLDLPLSTLPSMLKDQIEIDPEFQRRERWDGGRQSRLIESLLMNVPVPPIFLGEDEYGSYVVLDGRQRLTAIRNFLNNTLTLSGLSVWDDLNGLTFDGLVKRGLDKHLTRRFISAVVILKESSPLVKYDVFARLNTGGVQANDMEVRNAIFRGPFTDQLHKLSRHPAFCDLWGIPKDGVDAESNVIYKGMQDLAMVLRFFALSEPEHVENPLRDYLSEYMLNRNLKYKTDVALADKEATRFANAVTNAWAIFGKEAFRNKTKTRKTKSVPLAEAVLIALADVSAATITPAAADGIRKAVEELCANEDFAKAISTGTNGKGAIKTRVGMTKAAFSAFV